MKKLLPLLLIAVHCMAAFADEKVENTLSAEFLNQVAPIQGKIFKGVQPDGKECSVAVVQVIEPAYKSPLYPLECAPAFQKVILVAADDSLPEAISAITTTNELSALLFPSEAIDSGQPGKVYQASAGWCSRCGSGKADGKVAGLLDKSLEFYWAGFIPQRTDAQVTLNSDSTAIEEVNFYSYPGWYLPVVNWRPSESRFSCKISK